jgi:hypothetical protein
MSNLGLNPMTVYLLVTLCGMLLLGLLQTIFFRSLIDKYINALHKDIEDVRRELVKKTDRFELLDKQRESDIKFWEAYAKHREQIFGLLELKVKKQSMRLKEMQDDQLKKIESSIQAIHSKLNELDNDIFTLKIKKP